MCAVVWPCRLSPVCVVCRTYSAVSFFHSESKTQQCSPVTVFLQTTPQMTASSTVCQEVPTCTRVDSGVLLLKVLLKVVMEQWEGETLHLRAGNDCPFSEVLIVWGIMGDCLQSFRQSGRTRPQLGRVIIHTTCSPCSSTPPPPGIMVTLSELTDGTCKIRTHIELSVIFVL